MALIRRKGGTKAQRKARDVRTAGRMAVEAALTYADEAYGPRMERNEAWIFWVAVLAAVALITAMVALIVAL